MRIIKSTSALCALLLLAPGLMARPASGAQRKRAPAAKQATKDSAATAAEAPAVGKQEETRPAKPPGAKSGATRRAGEQAKAELEEIIKLPAAERIVRLRAFLDARPPASLRRRALEQLVSAHAARGDELLQAGDAEGGVELFRRAVALAPADMSDKLYVEVVAQFPANLFLRGQGGAASELARAIEEKVKTDAKRLLALAAFYLSVEQSEEAARLAGDALKLAPGLAAAHQALGTAQRLALKLDEAAASFARALELDPALTSARRSLADLKRATGKPEEALALYRALLSADAKDGAARTGVVLSLFAAGRREEAERELDAALKEESHNLPLLAGAAYWYAAHNEPRRALNLAGLAVRVEPRYTWAQVALARALVASKLPLDAERALRFARQYGRFPTLDYELASALAAAGFYGEAAQELARSFALKDGELETRLAGRTPARASNFLDLLAPERRASIFQFEAADSEANARMLKALLAFSAALGDQGAASGEAAAEAAREFAAGTDAMRAFRQLYAADRLLRRGVALATVLELTAGARARVEEALDTPAATAAVLAEELRDARADAIARGGTLHIPSIPRNVLSNILRGRVEELTGWALFNQGKADESVAALRRAVSVLPENSVYWRGAQWRLGTALVAAGGQTEALAIYLKSYDRSAPDPARRAIIEALYRKVNGSLEGLDAKLGRAPARVVAAGSANTPAPGTIEAPATSNEVAAVMKSGDAETKVGEAKKPETGEGESRGAETKAADKVEEKKAKEDERPAEPPALAAPTPGAVPSPTPEVPPSATPANDAQPAPNSTDATAPAPESSPTPESSPAEDASAANDAGATAAVSTRERPRPRRPRRGTATSSMSDQKGKGANQSGPAGACQLSLSTDSVLVSGNGGSSTVVVGFAGVRAGDIKASTASWSDIIIVREPPPAADPNAVSFTITSISRNTGNFTVTFKSPCGTRDLAVTVK